MFLLRPPGAQTSTNTKERAGEQSIPLFPAEKGADSTFISAEDLVSERHTAIIAESIYILLLHCVSPVSFMFALEIFFFLVDKTQVTESEHQLHLLCLPCITR